MSARLFLHPSSQAIKLTNIAAKICDDVMSLGMYGLSPLNAGMMLEKRWEEIHKNKFL